MYGLRSDRILRYFRCIGCEDEGSQLCIGAETGCNALGVANCVLDGRLLVLSCIPSRVLVVNLLGHLDPCIVLSRAHLAIRR
jgi:hypothetical protein